ncbi:MULTISPECIES: response regulator transcription factor [unclassified Arthrobacter]|uniref:response regulator transcription factor n=1 Tax=unclassified Arthrobacter TaxID=235627 RepID=UPI00254A0E3A|nr:MULTISPECIES: response regulator transcription factor [unclassified Arthrobacter]
MTPLRTCLVIEDDEDIGGLLEAILSSAGFSVSVEETGTDGLLAAAATAPSMITLDVGLPDMDGREVARALRKFTQVPIIMITAFAQPGDELDGIAAGATAYLSKPFRPAALRDLVQKLFPSDSDVAVATPAVSPIPHPLTQGPLP